MKRALFGVLGLALVAGLALAAGPTKQSVRWTFLGGLSIGPTADGTASNRITESLGASQSIDFAATTIVCNDSPTIAVPGAAAGDACFVGPPTTLPANSSFTCYVSAADVVKVRHCPAGTAVSDPAAATYYVRVFSSQ